MSDIPPPPPDDSDWTSPPPPPPESPDQAPKPVRGMATLGTGDIVELARPLIRLVARIIDAAIFFVISLIPLLVGLQDFDDLADEPLGMTLALTVIGLVYEVSLVATRGQTLGKMAMKIRIIRAGDGLIPGWDKSTVRWLVPAIPSLIGLVPPLGFVGLMSLVVYLSLTWDKVRQGWHDKAAKTLVVKV